MRAVWFALGALVGCLAYPGGRIAGHLIHRTVSPHAPRRTA